MDSGSRRATCLCHKCGKPAAEFAALDVGEGTGLSTDRERLERSGFLGGYTRPLPLASAQELIDHIRADHLEELAHADPDLFGFVCRECRRAYCQDCWHVEPPEFDDGFYDCTHGTCPAGHRVLLDD